MKFAMYGAGGVGGYFGARLAQAGHEVAFIARGAHLRAMKGVGDTTANLEAAVEGEGFEFQEMYPKFVDEAETEGNRAALISFKNALIVEEIHHGLYGKALDAVQGGGDLPERPIFVCGVCGNTVYDEAPDTCPVCGAMKKSFSEVK